MELVTDREDGLLTPVGEPEGLAETILAALQDPAQMARLAAQARTRVAPLTEQAMTDRALGRIEKLVVRSR